VGLAIRRSPREKEFQNAILFKNNPEAAKTFVEWFEHVVVPEAIPVELSAKMSSLAIQIGDKTSQEMSKI
jgi:hypothetical protein